MDAEMLIIVFYIYSDKIKFVHSGRHKLLSDRQTPVYKFHYVQRTAGGEGVFELPEKRFRIIYGVTIRPKLYKIFFLNASRPPSIPVKP